VLFEWHEDKRLTNIAKHGIDFIDAMQIWEDDVLEVPSDQPGHGEARYIAFGPLAGRIIAVVFVRRGSVLRLISARRARDHEREAYTRAFGRGP
jgi:uncharacterized DUF497 family protein